jgi:hypothetical protein
MKPILGLRIEIATALGKNGHGQVTEFLSRLGWSHALPARSKTRLTVADGYQRLDFIGDGPLGRNVSLVHSPKGRFWIQHDARVFVPFEPPAPPKPTRAEPTPTPSKSRARPAGKPAAPDGVAVIADPAMGRSVRVTATPNDKWRAPGLERQAIQALLGGASGEVPAGIDLDQWARFVAERGFPSELRFEVVDAAGRAGELLSKITVGEFAHEAVEPGAFTAPAGYRRWRFDPAQKPKKPTSSPPAGHAAMAPQSASGSSSDVGVSRQALDDRNDPTGGRDPGDGRGNGPPPPPPPPPPPAQTFTTQPRIGFRLDQLVLDHIAMIFNAAITPLRTVGTIGQGSLVFDWLDQLRNDVLRRGSSAAGTAIFQLLHDVTLPATPVTPRPTPASDFATFMCRGLIDQLAIRDAERRVRLGSYPTSITITLPPTMRTVIAGAGTNWDALPDGVKARLTFELVRLRYGTLRFVFPTGTPPGGALGLIEFQANNLMGSLTLPTAPAPTGQGDPPFNPLLTLTAGLGGNVSGTLSLGTLAVSAQLVRYPTANYFLLLAGAPIVLLFFPGLAWALGLVAGLTALFAADIVNASLTLSGLMATLSITFAQDAEGVFVPTTACTVNGLVSFSWTSAVPTGINQILAAIEQALIGSIVGMALRVLSDVLSSLANSVVARALGRGFPATALKLGLPISGGLRGGRAGVYTYLEAHLDPSRDPRFPAPAVATPTNLEAAQAADVSRVVPSFGADHYGSLSFDENFLNIALAGMRLAGQFDGSWPVGSVAAIRPLMPNPIPRALVNLMFLRPEAGPTMTLATSIGATLGSHGALTFDYRLTLSQGGAKPIAVIRFRVDTTGDLVLASAGPPDQALDWVRIVSLPNRAFDLLIQTASAVVTPTAFTMITVQKIETVSTEFDDRGKPHKVTEVDYVETDTSVPLTPAMIQALDPLLRRALVDTWWYRSPNRAPRRDGAPPANPPNPLDPITTFRYPLEVADPDTLTTAPHGRVELGLERRLGHFHLGHAGLATVALMPLRAGTLVPFVASFSSFNWASGILANVKVKASTMSSRDLSL